MNAVTLRQLAELYRQKHKGSDTYPLAVNEITSLIQRLPHMEDGDSYYITITTDDLPSHLRRKAETYLSCFAKEKPFYDGFRISYYKERLRASWLDATEGSALVLRERRDRFLQDQYTPIQLEEFVEKGVQWVTEQFNWDNLTAEAELGKTISTLTTEDMIRDWSVRSEDFHPYPSLVVRSFLAKYPVLHGMRTVLRYGTDIGLDWSAAC